MSSSGREGSTPGSPVEIWEKGRALYARIDGFEPWSGREVELRALAFFCTKLGDRLITLPDGSLRPLSGNERVPAGAGQIFSPPAGRGVLSAYPRDRSLQAAHVIVTREELARFFRLDLLYEERAIPTRIFLPSEVERRIERASRVPAQDSNSSCSWGPCRDLYFDSCSSCDAPLCQTHAIRCEADESGVKSTRVFCRRCVLTAGLIDE
jgi:hypothetical protein